MNEASSEARNRAVIATSAGIPIRPSGYFLATRAFSYSGGMLPSTIGVSINPGQMQLTRML